MTGWTVETMRTELDLPLVTAMFAEWNQTPTSAMSLLRIQRAVYAWAGIKEKPAPVQVDTTTDDEMQSLFGSTAPSAPVKILTPEEWLSGVNGNGRSQ